MVGSRVFLLEWVVMGRNQNHPMVMSMNGVLETGVIIRVGGGNEVWGELAELTPKISE